MNPATTPGIVAVVQMTSRDDLAKNLDSAARWVRHARSRGADLVALPENLSFMGREEDKVATAESFEIGALSTSAGFVRRWAADLARESGAWLLLGGVTERTADGARVHNTAIVVDPAGAIVARYRKIHLFDVSLADGTELRESKVVESGHEVVTCETPLGVLGLSICYDVRFAELYRRLARAGAEILTVPAAFTVPTGRDHWHVLLRARAIETQCYLIAPAQWGSHGNGRTTYGHALIVDPWGTVIAECADGEGVAVAEIDLARLASVRRQMPCASHARLTD